MVTEAAARRVAKQEQDIIIAVREGAFGEKAQEMSERLGLAGVVWSSLETTQGMVITDLITGESRIDPK
jgi:aspartate aminotransferase-like enzyme